MNSLSVKAHTLALINGYQSTCLIIAASQIGLFSALEPGGLKVTDLAAKLGVQPELLFRFVRALESLGLLRFDHNCVTLSDTGTHLAKNNSSLSSIPVLIAEQYLPAWSNIYGTLCEGKPAFERLFGLSVWDHRRDNPHLNDAFVNMITEPATNEIAAILDAYDFTSFRKIVDIGAGSGWLLSGILRKYPDTTGVLFDQPHVVHEFFKNVPIEIEGRCDAVGGSFFEFVPSGADLYLMQSILHDWDDNDCIRILRTVRTGMLPGGKLLILERVLPTEGVLPVHMAMLDMHMMAVLGGRERNLPQYSLLLEKAGFQLNRVISTVGLAADIIEVEIMT